MFHSLHVRAAFFPFFPLLQHQLLMDADARRAAATETLSSQTIFKVFKVKTVELYKRAQQKPADGWGKRGSLYGGVE